MANIWMYFLLCLMLNSITKTSSQCIPSNVAVTTVSSSQLYVTWACNPRNSEQFQGNYYLYSRDQCESSSTSASPSLFNIQRTDWITGYAHTLSNLKPYSTYYVYVQALGGGYSGHVIGNTLEAVPGSAPQSVTPVTNIVLSETQLAFEWNEIPCGSRKGVISYDYGMKYNSDNPVNSVFYTAITSTAGKLGVLVTGLDCGQSYKFRVAGQTSAGTGPYSNYAYATTTTTSSPTAPGTVSQLQVDISSTNTHLDVTWMEPSYRGCPVIDRYTVSYRGTSHLDECLLPADEGTSTTTTLSYYFFIRPYYSYTIDVNVVGGTTESVYPTTPQLAPSLYPANIHLTASTSTSLSFTWDEILCSYSNGVIVGYPYQYSATGDSSVIINGKASVTSVTISSLTPGTSYTFKVAARTLGGTGSYGSLETRTKDGVSPPTDIYADTILSTSLTFSWSMASCTGTCPERITGYSYILHNKAGMEIKSGTTGTSDRTVTIQELMPCTEYTLHVAGMTASATGTYGIGSSVTGGKAPGEVEGLTVNPSSDTSLSVYWRPPSTPCLAESYTIEYRLTNRDQCESISDGPRMTYDGRLASSQYVALTITDLYAYSTYEVFVYASNTYGQGQEISLAGMTAESAPTAAPSNVKVTSTGRTSLSFSWDEVPCGSRHRNIQQYHYQVDDANTGSLVANSIVYDTKVTISSWLQECKTYMFSVAAYSFNQVYGPYSEDIEAVTASAVDSLTVSPQSATELRVSWVVPSESCDTSAKYTIEYQLTNQDQCMPSDSNDRIVYDGSVSGMNSVTLTDLYAYSTYQVFVITGSSSARMNGTTSGSIPTGDPDGLRAEITTNTTITFVWSQPTCGTRHGRITGYTYTFRESGISKRRAEDVFTSNTSVTFDNLAPFTEYNISISANTNDGTGPVFSFPHRTLEGVPSPPTSLQESTTDGAAITFEWSAPETPNGNIVKYVIRYWKSGESSENAIEEIVEGDPLPMTHELKSLQTNTTYYIQIRAETSAYIGPWGEPINVFVPIGGGGGESSAIGAIAGSISVIIILIILIVVFILIKRRRKKLQDPPEVVPMKTQRASEPRVEESTYANQAAFKNGHQLYPDVSEVASKPEPKVKPDPAPKAMVLEPAVAIKSVKDKQEPSPKPAQSLQRDRPGTVYDDMEPDKSITPGPQNVHQPKPKKLKPVKVENLPEYIVKQSANQSQGFRAEFDAIPYTQEFPWDESEKDNNIKKNRYANISAYDHSRVILDEIKGVANADYINASYVKGFNDKIYIASQGPSKGAMSDIWRMAWLQNTAKIVMLTNMVEAGKRKCEKYWTDTKQPFVFPPMKLTHKKTQHFADFVIRDFVLEKDGEEVTNGIRQFHFISWPDMGLPEYPTPLINFLRIVNAYNPEGSGLPIIHCSAGVGRTGTYITVDSMLEMAKSEGKIDVQGAVRKLRQDRIKMVQTHGQYEFIYDTVQEALQCGDTAILVTNLRQGYADLIQTVNKKTGNTKLVDQFELLESLTYVPSKQKCFAAYSAENVDKNRFPDRVPSERIRPYLNTTGGAGSTNYINAAFIDGYLMKGEYIVTQMPLPHTVEDFWRMVYEQKTTSIVMLNGMSHSDPSLGTYWIDSGTLQLTFLTVEFQSTKKYMKEVVGRIFKIYPSDQPEDFLTVQQFQFLDWPLGQDIPNSTAPLIAMVGLMQKWQNKQRQIVGNKPIIVHCIDGIGVSGVFCALVCMMNIMKAEKAVNVFQSVKRLRMSRPGMVETLEQYNFLYKAAQEHLEEFDIYENFR